MRNTYLDAFFLANLRRSKPLRIRREKEENNSIILSIRSVELTPRV